jgi:hypothetical protein
MGMVILLNREITILGRTNSVFQKNHIMFSFLQTQIKKKNYKYIKKIKNKKKPKKPSK